MKNSALYPQYLLLRYWWEKNGQRTLRKDSGLEAGDPEQGRPGRWAVTAAWPTRQLQQVGWALGKGRVGPGSSPHREGWLQAADSVIRAPSGPRTRRPTSGRC